MLNPVQIEDVFRKYLENLSTLAHDGVIHVDLQFLYDCNLLENIQQEKEDANDLTQYFHVIESAEKVTLFNEQFVIWIIPRMEQDVPSTFVLIALCHNDNLHLEIVFTTSGVYNTPKYVLKILQYFLIDMLETEATISSMEEGKA